jgi:hypothetical protein
MFQVCQRQDAAVGSLVITRWMITPTHTIKEPHLQAVYSPRAFSTIHHGLSLTARYGDV